MTLSKRHLQGWLWLSTGLISCVVVIACAMPGSDAPMILQSEESDASAEVGSEGTGLIARTLTRALDDPWGLAFLPGGDLLVTEREGELKRLRGDDFSASSVSGVPDVAAEGQGGLMDVLVHPDFERNSVIYLSYAIRTPEGLLTTRVSRGRLRGNQLSDVQDVFTASPGYRARRHFGSRLLLADGYLYITVGDRGNRDLAQTLETHNGKVMRLKEDGSVPADNPFVGQPGALPEIFTYGHRNPQGIAQHPVSGEVWVAEHGPQGGDEINALRPGANYGWPLATYGEEYGGGKIGRGTHVEGTVQPLVHWVPSLGTSGMAFYDGTRFPKWNSSLLVSGLRLTRVSRLELEGDALGTETRLMAELKMRVRDVRIGPDGLVYVLADGSRLLRLEPQG